MKQTPTVLESLQLIHFELISLKFFLSFESDPTHANIATKEAIGFFSEQLQELLFLLQNSEAGSYKILNAPAIDENINFRDVLHYSEKSTFSETLSTNPKSIPSTEPSHED